MTSAQLFGNRYTVFRNDRSHLNSQKTRGGGVLIAVSVELSCRNDPAPVFNTVEQLWVIVETANSDISIGVIYIPPDRKSDSQVIQQHIDSIGMVLSRLELKTPALLFGDYNQSGLRWFIPDNGHPSVDTLHSNMPAYCCSLNDGLCWHGLTQVNNILIDNERLLDLVWVNDETLPICSVSAAHEPLVELEAVHPAIVLSLNLSSTIVYDEPSELRALNFRRADYATLTAALGEINWNAVLEPSISIDNAVNSFSSTLESVFAQTVSFFEPPRKPPWSNPRLRTLKRLRSAALRKYCCYRSAYNRNQFTTASCQYRNYNRYLYNRYVRRIQSNLRVHPKQFWSFVNTKRKERGLPTSMFLGNNVANNENEKCNLFAEQFQQIFNESVASPEQVREASNVVPRDVLSFRLPHISPDDVVAALNKLKSSYAVGPDGIPSAVLKRCGEVLSTPIAMFFNLSVQQCTFPDRWKFSYLFPVYKKRKQT
ncbi:uncharacterized protein LOC129719807 [Wyeomyia smithii]|uniref:uncharacterized protein LOC129719807 n=1 Tax=Wyeomyia smithii TaxID=174621 RepID=UPI002467FB26|nr:uncharacterized protein LOC129719807 [Wyeomyia smithii]